MKEEENPVWVNLGCGDDIKPGFVNVDFGYKHPQVLNHDLSTKWPWVDGTIDYVIARDIIEHLPNKIFTMNELWRALKPGGVVEIVVPTTDGPGAFQDPTHVSFWNRNSFKYFEDGNPYRERFASSYGICARFEITREVFVNTTDGPKLTIVLKAVKN